MLLAYLQRLDPLDSTIFWSGLWSTILAALPVIVLFWTLVPMRWLAPKAGLAGSITAIVIAIAVYGMPADMALWSFANGAAFGLLPVGWTIFNAMLLYNITVETGQFTIVRRSVAGISGDARIQAILIGFSFGAFLEGAAGGGTPVAICGAIMVGLGFNPFLAAVLCLIANTSPVAYGGLGTPLIVLNGVTDLRTETLSTMAGHQLPIMSVIVPLWMVKCMCSWKQTLEVWPALAVSGGSFAIFQFVFATIHEYVPNVVLYPMTDIGGGIFSLVVSAIFLQFWKPKNEWHFDTTVPSPSQSDQAAKPQADDPHAAGAADLMASAPQADEHETKKLTAGNVTLAWMPYILMSIFLMLTGLVRQKETPVKPGPGPVKIVEGLHTNYQVPIPTLHGQCHRDARLHPVRVEEVAALAVASNQPLAAAANVAVAQRRAPRGESALFNFAWLTAPGTAVFFAVLVSMAMLRMNALQIGRVVRRTFFQMRIPIPTIAFMLGLSYVTRYSGMDATLGYAFAMTGVLYPFFAAMLGWLGVFLTGTDAGSNALFGSLQKITATEIFNNHPALFEGNLARDQVQVLICTANSTGGVMGKMIDAQSICVATAATHQLGKEADIFKAVIWHSVILAAMVGALTLLQAYVYPFTLMVPSLPP
ncbi:MAG: L-lactate permease [Gemmataceae bacterium]|nr:L-lactate permease [Gemmataceae bacterium]MCI0738629.1 L-lactate permease [Gemmataceae bacterium]